MSSSKKNLPRVGVASRAGSATTAAAAKVRAKVRTARMRTKTSAATKRATPTAPREAAKASHEAASPVEPTRRPRGRPRQMPLDEQREQILAAATRLFVEQGLDGVTSERIAEACGVGRPSVYQLFGSKNDVFIAAVDRAFTRLLGHMSRSFRKTATVRGRKQAVANITEYFDLVTREPDTFRMLMLADVSGDARTREAAKAIRRRLQDGLAAYMRATWEGFQDLVPRDADLAAMLIASGVEASAVYHLERPDRTTPEVVQFVADFVWAGIYDLAVGHDIPMGRKGARTPKS